MLKEILARANSWEPEGGWGDRPRLVGRDLWDGEVDKSLQAFQGEWYLNPGRDAATIAQASSKLCADLKDALDSRQLNDTDAKRAQFILDCVKRPMGDFWVKTAVIAKIRCLHERIEVFVGDPERVWPRQGSGQWPDAWNLYKLERFVRWDSEPESAGRYWKDWTDRGPCPGGAWPVFYRPFLGCVCCTNGMILPRFGRGFWTCWPPKRAIALRVDGGSELVHVPSLPRVMAQRLTLPDASPEDMLRGQSGYKFQPPRHLSGTRSAAELFRMLASGRVRPLNAVASLVMNTIDQDWPLEEQLVAEELAGMVAQTILDALKKVGGQVEMEAVSNPYRKGSSYHTIFDRLRQHPPLNKESLIEYAMTACNKGRKRAGYDVDVILTPRIDRLGHSSAQGDEYYVSFDSPNNPIKVFPRTGPVQLKPKSDISEQKAGNSAEAYKTKNIGTGAGEKQPEAVPKNEKDGEQMSGKVLAKLFDVLKQELALQKRQLGSASKAAIDKGNYEAAEKILVQIRELDGLQKRLDSLAVDLEQWAKDSGVAIEGFPIAGNCPAVPQKDAPQKQKRQKKTQQTEYFVPILETLVSGGGRMKTNDVLNQVFEKVKDRLLPYDLKPLKSNPAMPRWRNTAQWGRNSLRELGYMRSDSPKGIWEISDQGREWLRQQQREKQ